MRRILCILVVVGLAGNGYAQEESWTATSLANAPSARWGHTTVWTGYGMIVWGGSNQGGTFLNTGAVYDPTTDSWTPTSTTNAPGARYGHTAVWTGSRMIVWGGVGDLGEANTGAIYDATADTWTPTTTTNAPGARFDHTAIWTGSRMIVWGGFDGSRHVNTGAAYDPTTDTWAPTSTTSAIERGSHTAVWTGSRMIVWGGIWDHGLLNTGATYDPTADMWTPTTTTNAPGARYGHTAAWTGSRMIVWGGYDTSSLNTGAAYDPSADTWTPTSAVDAPLARGYHTAVWTGSRMVVWGGLLGGISNSDTGAAYDLTAGTWTATTMVNAPGARCCHTAVWTGSRMIVWGGGGNDSTALNTGGVYFNPAVLPPPPPPADFFTVTPCRLVDTRKAAGPTGGPALSPGATRNFPVAGGVCGIPSTAIAVSVNLTVTQPAAQGHLILYPGDAAGPPLVSNISFTAGVTRANNAIVRLATNGGTINVKNGGAGAVHFVLDVNGYFDCIPPPCPVPIAVYLSVTSAAGGPVPGLTVDLVGSRSGNVQCNVEETHNRCVVPGGYGTYQLRVAAPGFRTVDLSVVVPGSDAPRCQCGTVQTQELEVVLTPS